MKKHLVNGLLLFGVVILAIYIWRSKFAKIQPNVLIIVADDLGYGDLSSYGATDLRTPHIDSLLLAGARFTNYHTNSPVCSPTRAALLSGKYPHNVGVPGIAHPNPPDNFSNLADTILLLPQYLKKIGYQTALIGKWHLGMVAPDLPNSRGFDLYKGHLIGKMENYYNYKWQDSSYMRINDKPLEITTGQHATELYSDWAIDFLRQTTDKNPFFLMLAYNAPHNPIQPPDHWRDRYRQQFPQQTDSLRAEYAAFVSHLDEQIGRVLAELRREGKDQNTIVVFLSDNGASLPHGGSNGKWHGSKGGFYEGAIRVPMGISYAQAIKPHQTTASFALTMDILPTLLDLVDYPRRDTIRRLEGKSLASLWSNSPESENARRDRDVFWYRVDSGEEFEQNNDIEAWQNRQWKIIRPRPKVPYELYYLATDSLEQHNLWETYPQTADTMRQQLEYRVKAAQQIGYQ